jgi:glutamine synthetase
LTNPTINSYRRFRPNSLAPDRIAWGVDSRAAMVRAILDDEPQSVRLENRVGDPAANPYLYLASQVISGVDGMRNKAVPAEPSTAAYEIDAPRLPAGLAGALEHLEQDSLLRRGLGDAFVEYFVHIKRAELARFDLEVTAWEQREYFELF